ncbi:putative methyltransferase-domain-containing protein [Lasiosphaeria ovina]|uniref:Protein-lysine N-methyltransferase EFM6 n=1 Tax=Lasiosphaeria ovina TaxID=92902 RepID=A0AAE0N746_9PEZI|nr:putative methyltransferase-domain-containing protein [Lasiosphaeria ovina]
MSNEEEAALPDGFSTFDVDEQLAPVPDYKRAGDTTFLDFSGLLAEPLKLQEDLKTGCGGQLWPAGIVLAKHMLRYHRDKLQHSRILELGAGSGLVGLAIAKGSSIDLSLYITDQVEMEALMQHNIVLNRLQGQVETRVLNWGVPLSPEVVEFKPEIILAADCVYFEPAFPLLLRTLHDLLELNPLATIYFCFNKRRRADIHMFKTARKAFHVTEIEDADRPIFSRQGIFLVAFTRKSLEPTPSRVASLAQ